MSGGGGAKPYDDWVPCDKSRCNSQGTCLMNPKNYEIACTCNEYYTGQTCQIHKDGDDKIWGLLDKSAGLNVFLVVGIFIIILIFIALVVIICCFSKLKKDVHKMQSSSPQVLESRSLDVGEDRVDVGIQPADAKQISSSQHGIGNDSKESGSDAADPSTHPGSPGKSREFKNTRPSPIFSTLRRNYQPLEGRGDKSIKMSPLFGRPGPSYRPLPRQKSDNKSSSTFTHYVIGPPGGRKPPATSDTPAPLRSSEEQPLKALPEGGKVDPKLEEELKGILKELGEYVNDNQRLSQASDLRRPQS